MVIDVLGMGGANPIPISVYLKKMYLQISH
jgi:hypothetical protein